ncbi:MAG: biotin-dependent carboxyltransferase family protein [Thalassotalea sp.]
MNQLTIIKQQGQISVQDLGRFAFQHHGFSASGASDEYALLAGNKLLGNTPNDAALEIVFGQATFTVNCRCTLVITGADCQAKVNNKAVKHWQVITLQQDDKLTLNRPVQGIYSYLCIFGGIQTEAVLGSRCTLPAALNLPAASALIFPLAKNAENHLNPQTDKIALAACDHEIPALDFYGFNDAVLHVRFIRHHTWLLLSDNERLLFTEQPYQVASDSNKMGYRLIGRQALAAAHLYQNKRLSKPVTLGTIQLPKNGQPIVLMKDRQTIGGYATLGAVIQVDIPRLAQRQAHQKIQFIEISIAQAQAQLSAFYQKFYHYQ